MRRSSRQRHAAIGKGQEVRLEALALAIPGPGDRLHDVPTGDLHGEGVPACGRLPLVAVDDDGIRPTG